MELVLLLLLLTAMRDSYSVSESSPSKSSDYTPENDCEANNCEENDCEVKVMRIRNFPMPDSCIPSICHEICTYSQWPCITATQTTTCRVDHTPSVDICTNITVTAVKTVTYTPQKKDALTNLLATTTSSLSYSANTANIAGSANTGLAVLGSFTVLLALLLVVTITGWIYTAMISRRKNKTVNETSKEGGSREGIHNPVYGAGTLTGTDNQSVVQCNTQTPEYERVAIDNTNGYDVIDSRVPRPPPVSHTQNNESTDQDYSVLDSEDIEHDYHVLEDPAGGGLLSGGGVQDYEVPITSK